jgi:molybdopterin converting factor small subunit
MRITIELMAQLRVIHNKSQWDLELDEGSNFADLLRHLQAQQSSQEQPSLITEDGELAPSILASIGDRVLSRGAQVALNDGDRICFFSPIAGG